MGSWCFSVSLQRYSYFSFQCIKLVDDPQEKAGNVSLQILNYSHRTYNADCGRLKRSVDHLNSCQKIECSEKRHHSLSLGRFKQAFNFHAP